MGCRERQSTLQEYAAGELASAQCRELEAHLERCAACARDLEAYRLLARGLEQLPEPALPPGFHEELMAELQPQLGRWRVERETRLHRTVRRGIAAVLGAAFALSLSVALWQWLERIAGFTTQRFTQDLGTFWSYLQDLWYLFTVLDDVLRTLQPTFAGLWDLWRRSTGPLQVWGPLGVALYAAVLGCGAWLCWRALREREEGGIQHAA